jgi:hypothetical protein
MIVASDEKDLRKSRPIRRLGSNPSDDLLLEPTQASYRGSQSQCLHTTTTSALIYTYLTTLSPLVPRPSPLSRRPLPCRRPPSPFSPSAALDSSRRLAPSKHRLTILPTLHVTRRVEPPLLSLVRAPSAPRPTLPATAADAERCFLPHVRRRLWRDARTGYALWRMSSGDRRGSGRHRRQLRVSRLPVCLVRPCAVRAFLSRWRKSSQAIACGRVARAYEALTS